MAISALLYIARRRCLLVSSYLVFSILGFTLGVIAYQIGKECPEKWLLKIFSVN
jgi:hypothetical protein